MMLAASAFATTKGDLQLATTVNVNGTQLPPGEYKVKWEGTGPNVEASIMQGKTVVATVPAKLVEMQKVSNLNAAVVHKGDDGSLTLNQIRFSGKKYALEVTDQSVARTTDSGK